MKLKRKVRELKKKATKLKRKKPGVRTPAPKRGNYIVRKSNKKS